MRQEMRCEDCRFYVRQNNHDGKCYAHPPQIYYPLENDSGRFPKHIRPTVKADDFCRYWQ